jgi:hypothetical protein
MDRGPRTGVTGAVSASDLHYVRGWGRRARAAVRGSRTLVDGLMDWVFDRRTSWPTADDFEFNYNN